MSDQQVRVDGFVRALTAEQLAAVPALAAFVKRALELEAELDRTTKERDEARASADEKHREACMAHYALTAGGVREALDVSRRVSHLLNERDILVDERDALRKERDDLVAAAGMPSTKEITA